MSTCLCGEYWLSAVCPVLDHRQRAQRVDDVEASARELIRRLVMDYGYVCDHPETCACSMAQAARLVGDL